MGRSRTFFGDKDQIPSGQGKRKGRGMGGEAQKGVSGKIPIIKQDTNYLTNCWSDKLLITTIGIGMPKKYYAGTVK